MSGLYPTGPSNALGNDPIGDDNLRAADTLMILSKQEKDLYKRHLKNLTGPGGVDNPDGSRSTLFSMSVGINNKVYMIPTVWDGKILSSDEAIKRAEDEGLDKFPSYKNQEEAEKRYGQLHNYMEKDVEKLKRGGR